MAQKGHNFLSDHWITLKFLQEFPESVFLLVAMESLLGDEKGLVGQTRVSAQKGHNFWSAHWINLKFLQELPEAVLLRVVTESLLDD